LTHWATGNDDFEIHEGLSKTNGYTASRSAMQRFCRRHGIRPYRPTYRHPRGDPVKQAQAAEELVELRTGAEAGELVLLSQDEAAYRWCRRSMECPGVKGHRPTVGTRDRKDLQ
jgi:hypothetical protein